VPVLLLKLTEQYENLETSAYPEIWAKIEIHAIKYDLKPDLLWTSESSKVSARSSK
jgi:hypothetical protein